MDGEGKGFLGFRQMGLQVCLQLVHVLLKCIPLHEQRHVHGVIVLMEVGLDLELIPNICKKLK